MRLRQGGSLSVQGGQDLQDENDVAQQIRERKSVREVVGSAPRCGKCSETGHNARTFENDDETLSEEDSE